MLEEEHVEYKQSHSRLLNLLGDQELLVTANTVFVFESVEKIPKSV